jgi:hypothetical protein
MLPSTNSAIEGKNLIDNSKVLGTSSPPLFFDGGRHCELAEVEETQIKSKTGAEVRAVPIRSGESWIHLVPLVQHTRWPKSRIQMVLSDPNREVWEGN